ncbi:MAG TPA: TetR/AcrR family transcriptional regulator [Xanthobacteraceae bacterium]|nr:TetR/AcrR family transcriptional regulator [Xanthobacteraceae bacterium]
MKRKANGDANPRKDLVRERLIDTAAELFARRGYSRTTINDIAKELGLRRSSLYHYFRNKEEILDALIDQQTIEHAETLKNLLTDKSIKDIDKLHKAFTRSVLYKLTASARFRVLDQIEFEMPEKQAHEHRRRKREILELWSRLITEGIAAGELRPVDARMAAFALLGISNWTAWWYQKSGKLKPEEVAQALVEIGLYGIVRPEEDQKDARSLGAAIDRLKFDIRQLERLAR